MVKNSPANAGDIRDVGSIPGSEDPLKESMTTHSSILAWRIPWTEEPGWATVYGVTEPDTAEHAVPLGPCNLGQVPSSL